MFDQNGFDVTVLEPVYAGYGWVPDLDLQDYPDIRRFNVRGYFRPEAAGAGHPQQQGNFFCYALMAAQLCIQANLYDYGTPRIRATSLCPDEGLAGQSTDGHTHSERYSAQDSWIPYNVLANLPEHHPDQQGRHKHLHGPDQR